TLPAVRAAAEWLDLAGDLVARTEEYFFREVATDAARAAAALRSCAAPLLARCVEALAGCGGAGAGDGDGDGGGGGWLEEVAALPPEEFGAVAEAMRARCAHDHDLLYRIVDHYLENHEDKLTEEEKSRLCYSVNCTKLSHSLFMHLVQNPRLPLRFVVQAMLVEQLNTHRSFFPRTAATAAAASSAVKPSHNNNNNNNGSGSGGGVATTLGAILNRDAALRQSAQLRSSMQATSFRIEGLEREIAALRRCLQSVEDGEPGLQGSSASFRILPDDAEDGGGAECSGAGGRDRWSFGAKLVRGLKSFFKKPGSAAAAGRSGFRGGGGCDGGGGVVGKEVVEIERRPKGHRRNRSLV
ncbi:BTB/POZ domain-containing protein, partial [Ananas comosus]